MLFLCIHVAFLASPTPEVKIAGLSLSNMLSSSSFVVFLPAKRTNTHPESFKTAIMFVGVEEIYQVCGYCSKFKLRNSEA